jgi:hypothetical protein
LKNISQVREIPRRYSISRNQLFFLNEELNDIEEKQKNKEEIKSKNRAIEIVKASKC